MGIFLGHFSSGIVFFFFSLWWSFAVPLRYIRSRTEGKKFTGRTSYQCFFCPVNLQKYPIESSLKLFLLLCGVLAEVIMGFQNDDSRTAIEKSAAYSEHHTDEVHHHDHKREDMNNSTSTALQFGSKNAQHLTMYASFAIGAAVEILIHYKVHLPPRIDHVFGILCFVIEGFTFQFHLHGRDAIYSHLHILLTIAIYACVFSGILEYINPHNILFAYARIIFTMLQGTWLCYMGFIIYPIFKSSENQWDPNNHMHIMVLTVTFIWHFLLIFMGLLVQFLILNRIYGTNYKDSVIDDDEAEEIKYEKVMLVVNEANNNDDDFI